LTDEQKQSDTLAELGELCTKPEANIIKLPNISASIPQLNEAITELRTKGYDVPLYVPNPKTEKEKVIHSRYARVLGSAVNPVIREGNSDRRVAAPVKAYAKKNPHTMGGWSRASRSHVAHMDRGDFYGTEQSAIMPKACSVKIEHVAADGSVTTLKENLKLKEGEIIDASFMSIRELRSFLEKEIEDAHKEHMLLSVHLKATMMKVRMFALILHLLASCIFYRYTLLIGDLLNYALFTFFYCYCRKVSDPIIFGHCVEVFFKPVFEKHAATFKEIGVNPNNGLQALYDKLKNLPEVTRQQVEKDINDCYETRPWLAMVNSDKGITNLHVPSDVIIDASMPVVIRDSGKMWNQDGELEDVKCIVPDRCYATMYQEVMSFCKQYGQFDVATMGNVANVGLM
jgi:isocitrate dehydrogenase